MTLTLLIADDEPDVADVVAFGARIVWPDCNVTFARTGNEALRSVEREMPDLVVLDVSMPPPDGFEVCRRIRETSQVPILMLTVHDGTIDKVRALDLGADDYVIKPFDHLELLARLRALVRRISPQYSLEPDTPDFSHDGLSINFATREVSVDGEVIRLTDTEYRMLEELVRHRGTALPHSFLLDSVWGSEWGADPRYLKVYVRRLRQKLGDDAENPRYIQTEWGIGYRFVPGRSS